MRTPILALLMVAAFAAVSCSSDDNPAAPSPAVIASLEGSWKATKAVFTSVAPPTRTVDIVAQGSTLTLVLAAGGTYTLTITEPGLPPVVQTGTWSAGGDVLTLSRSSTSNSQFDKTLNGNSLVLAGGSALFEFTDGVLEEAKLTMTLARQ